jgi:uncharacterized protein
MSEQLEQRTVDLEHLQVEGRTIVGRAAVFNCLSEELPGGFRERILPNAFSGVLDSDVRLVVNHDVDRILARTKSKTLKISQDDQGLAFSATLPNTSYANDLRESIARGDVDSCSFRFVCGEESWDGDVREVRTVKELHDLTIATGVPAYSQTSVELRSRPNQQKETNVDQTSTSTSASASTYNVMTSTGSGLQVEDRSATTSTPTIEDAIVDFVKGTKRGEARALTTATGVSQTQTSTLLFDKLRAASVFLSTGVNVLATDSDSILFPQLTTDVTPGAYAEGATITPSDPTIGTVQAVPRKYAHLVQLSNELVEDSDPSILTVLNNHLTATLALKLDLDFFEGSGTPPVLKGLANVSNIQTVATVGSFTDLDWVATAIQKLETENVSGPYVLVTHPRTLKRLRTIKVGTASSVEPLLEGPLAGQDIPFSVYGVPVVSSSQLSIVEGVGTNENSAYIYAPSQLYCVRRSDVVFEVDRSRLFNSDQSEVRIKTRLDLLCPNPKSIVRASGILA